MPIASKPEGYTAATPWIIGPDTRGLLAFTTRAFGATEIAIVPTPMAVWVTPKPVSATLVEALGT